MRGLLTIRTCGTATKTCLFPKTSQGNWISIDPKFDGGMGGRDFYDENNGWTYKWQVQHDVNGLIGLMGGKKQFENNLDQLYREGLGRSKYEFWVNFQTRPVWLVNIPWVTSLVSTFLTCTISVAPEKRKSAFVSCWMFGSRTTFLEFPVTRTEAV